MAHHHGQVRLRDLPVRLVHEHDDDLGRARHGPLQPAHHALQVGVAPPGDDQDRTVSRPA